TARSPPASSSSTPRAPRTCPPRCGRPSAPARPGWDGTADCWAWPCTSAPPRARSPRPRPRPGRPPTRAAPSTAAPPTAGPSPTPPPGRSPPSRSSGPTPPTASTPAPVRKADRPRSHGPGDHHELPPGPVRGVPDLLHRETGRGERVAQLRLVAPAQRRGGGEGGAVLEGELVAERDQRQRHLEAPRPSHHPAHSRDVVHGLLRRGLPLLPGTSLRPTGLEHERPAPAQGGAERAQRLRPRL